MTFPAFIGIYSGTAIDDRLWVPLSARTTDGTYQIFDYTLTSDSGNDTLVASGGPENWTAFNSAADPLKPLAVFNHLSGGDGADLLYSSFRLAGLSVDQSTLYSRADTLEGGAGNDRYFLRDDNVTIIEGDDIYSGTDTIFLSRDYFERSALTYFELTYVRNVENVTISGTLGVEVTGSEHGNVIRGGLGGDTLYGLEGLDTIFGGIGADSLLGGDNQDRLIGGTGNDFLYGELADDHLIGGDGDDWLRGGFGNDRLIGGAGNDLMEGNDEDDTLLGGADDDDLTGYSGFDDLYGGAGNDKLNGGAEDDLLNGGTGNDLMDGDEGDDTFFVDSAQDSVIGGTGLDTVISSNLTLFAFNFADVEALALYGADELDIYAETATHAMSLSGNAADNWITGSDYGDTLSGGLGADTLSGGAGDDLYILDNPNDTVLEFTGNDTVESSTISINAFLFSAIESFRLTGTANLDVFGGANLTGNDGNNVIAGFSYADQLYGNAGNDTLRGYYGSDTMFGGQGDDQLDAVYGGSDRAEMTGGDGNDIYIVDDNFDVVTELAGTDSGMDEVQSAYFDLDIANYANVEKLVLLGNGRHDLIGTSATTGLVLVGNGQDNDISGGSGNDSLYGGEGVDTLSGGDGDDWIIAGAGNSPLTGGDGNDSLFGGAGLDSLYGGYGDDDLSAGTGVSDLTGGVGADKFIFTPQSGVYTLIWDFEVGTDKIDLRSTDITSVFAASDRSGHTGNGVASAVVVPDGYFQMLSLDYDGDGTSDENVSFLNSTVGLSSNDFLINGFTGTSDPFFTFIF